MDYESRLFMNDNLCYKFIKKVINNENPHTIIRKNVVEQKKYAKKLKTMGIPINQISRITGISRYIIKWA